MYQLFNNHLQQDAHECLCLIYETLERATSIPITLMLQFLKSMFQD